MLRLVGAVLLEVHDEWQVADRAYFSDHSLAQLVNISDHDPTTKEVTTDTLARRPPNRGCIAGRHTLTSTT